LAGATIGCVLFAVAAVLSTRFPFVLMIVPLMLAAAYFPPFCIAVISACVGAAVVALGVGGTVPDLAGGPGAHGGFQLSVAVAVVLPFLASLLMKQMRRDQRRVQESEQRFRRAMEDSAIGMALVALDGKILEANRAFVDMLGYTAAELQAKTFFEITYPEDVSIGRETVRRALAGEADSYRFEKRYVRRDGTPLWALLAGSVIRDHETGKPLYLVSQIEDIDSRKKAESTLKEAENRWSFALESARQGVWDFDLRKGRTFYSPMWKEIIGYREDELGDSPELWLDLTHPEDRERVRDIDNAHMAGETPAFEAEFRMRHKDGHWVWVLDRGMVLERDAKGAAIRAIGTHTDITRQKEAEARLAATAQELTDERERLRITLHSIADAVICTDASSLITFMNPAAEALTGIDIVTAYGEPLEAAYCPIDEETGERTLPTSELGEGLRSSNQSGRAVLVRPDRTRRNIREIVSPILTAKDDIAGSVIVFQDVTDARAMQRDLAHAASHDPLTGLANRSSFVRALMPVLEEAKAECSENALLFVDLDRFKAVNDTAGHLAGDALLKRVAGKIKAKVRSHDVVARFGGDEFAILLRSCSTAAARSIAEGLVVAIRDLGFTWQGNPYQVGASIGVAPITAGTSELDEIVAQADEACYASKAAGRGCVSVFEARADGRDAVGLAAKQARSAYPEKLAG
jgi:diguanylate cyclase (GGDEF)-like protein/PAS domain S-box-containing protein